MPTFPNVQSRPVSLTPSMEGQVYGLTALALGLTFVGAFLGMRFGILLLHSPIFIVLVLLELAIIFTSRWWADRYPLNYLLFGFFPLLSGFTFTPFILAVVSGYTNGAAILVNALVSTAFMTAAAAVAALATGWNLSGLGRGLFLGVIGLIILGILQVFIPSFRTGQFELLLSGAGIVIFALFTAYDIQRIAAMGRAGANPFLLALSLYLDIFNLFVYVVRFMLEISGRRR